MLQGKTIKMYDLDEAAKNNKLPLTHLGSRNTDGLLYPNLVDSYYWKDAYFSNVTVSEIKTNNP